MHTKCLCTFHQIFVNANKLNCCLWKWIWVSYVKWTEIRMIPSNRHTIVEWKKRIKERKIHMKVMKLLWAKSNALMKESLIEKKPIVFLWKRRVWIWEPVYKGSILTMWYSQLWVKAHNDTQSHSYTKTHTSTLKHHRFQCDRGLMKNFEAKN